MTTRLVQTLVATSLLLGLASTTLAPAHAQAQAGTLTRAQVKMDRDTFLAMARWDDNASAWVLRDNMPMPAGVPSREEVKAMRDKFLSAHTWDENTGQLTPKQGAPRDMSKLTRDQVKMETARFLKTHRFDESSSTWVMRNR